jgi:hypothetical protein
VCRWSRYDLDILNVLIIGHCGEWIAIAFGSFFLSTKYLELSFFFALIRLEFNWPFPVFLEFLPSSVVDRIVRKHNSTKPNADLTQQKTSAPPKAIPIQHWSTQSHFTPHQNNSTHKNTMKLTFSAKLSFKYLQHNML